MRITSSGNIENGYLIPETSDEVASHVINPHVTYFVLILLGYNSEVLLSVVLFVCLP